MIHVDADTARVGAFMGHWVCERGNLFTAVFQSGAWTLRPHHKATTSTDLGFGVFLAYVNAGLRDVASGKAFAPEA